MTNTSTATVEAVPSRDDFMPCIRKKFYAGSVAFQDGTSPVEAENELPLGISLSAIAYGHASVPRPLYP